MKEGDAECGLPIALARCDVANENCGAIVFTELVSCSGWGIGVKCVQIQIPVFSLGKQLGYWENAVTSLNILILEWE